MQPANPGSHKMAVNMVQYVHVKFPCSNDK